MNISMEQVPIIAATGASALAIASLLWAARVSSGARGAARQYREKMGTLEEQLARADSVFGAYAGVVLIWEDSEFDPDVDDLGTPRVYGSPLALAGLLKFTDEALADDPAIRILEGLADHEARDSSGQDTTLRVRLHELRRNGSPFSLTIIGPNNRLLEADGRTAGARAVVWITDATIKKLEESAQRSRFVEAERIIAENPQAFLNMMERAPFPAWQVSGMGKITWANPAYLTSVEAKDVRHAVDRQVMLSQDISAQARRTIQENKDIDEIQTAVIEGENRALRVLTFPLAGGAGAMAFDVTEQDMARRELKRHVKAHEETLNHVQDGIAIFSRERKLTYHNKAFADMWGLEESYLITQPSHGQILDQLRADRKLPTQKDYATWRAEELSRYQDLPSENDKDQWDLPNGDTVSITRQRHPLGGLLLIFRDLSDEIDLKTRFEALNRTQTAALNNLHEAVAVFSQSANLQLCNDAFKRLWQLDDVHVVNSPDFTDLVEHCTPLFHDREIWKQVRARITDPSPDARQETTGEMQRSDGSVLTYLTQPLPDGNTLIAFVDVTATRRVETALRERAEAFETADRLKTEFVRNVSYQLRSPLTTIMGYAEFLESKRHGELNERQNEFVTSILTASDHLNKLIENILDLALIEAGRMDLELSDVAVASLVEDSVEMVVSKAADTQITVRAELGDGLGSIRADEKRIRQVLFNLVSNALRFTDPGGEVVLSAERAGDMVRLKVGDTGRGIDAEQQVASWDSFHSGDKRGAGLGLSLVKHFVELHGGEVMLRSEPGEGSEVICLLPAIAKPRVTTPEIDLVATV